MFLIIVLGFIKLRNTLYSKHRPNFKINLNDNEKLERSLEPPSGGELKLLTYLNAQILSQKWLEYVSNNENYFDEHFTLDYMNMKGLSSMYITSDFFYLGFFPDGKITNDGPKYIGLFNLDHRKRIFHTKFIIENPYIVNDETKLKKFKEYLIELTDDAYVFFDYKQLNVPGQLRYYLEWTYN